MRLTTADGTHYTVQRFDQALGVAKAVLLMEGVVYPATEKWYGCTLVLGERTFENVRAFVQEIGIYDPLDPPREVAPGVVEMGLQPDTTYTVLLMIPPTPDDTQEADAVRKPPV